MPVMNNLDRYQEQLEAAERALSKATAELAAICEREAAELREWATSDLRDWSNIGGQPQTRTAEREKADEAMGHAAIAIAITRLFMRKAAAAGSNGGPPCR